MLENVFLWHCRRAYKFKMNIFWTTRYTKVMQPVGRRWHAGLYFVTPGSRFANNFFQALRIPLTSACRFCRTLAKGFPKYWLPTPARAFKLRSCTVCYFQAQNFTRYDWRNISRPGPKAFWSTLIQSPDFIKKFIHIILREKHLSSLRYENENQD